MKDKLVMIMNTKEKILFAGTLYQSNYNLSNKEIEILINLYNGKKPQEISLILGVSKNTIKSHLKNIYNKFDVNSYHEGIILVQNLLNNTEFLFKG